LRRGTERQWKQQAGPGIGGKLKVLEEKAGWEGGEET
jgi:hypothetical protein